MIRAVLLAAVFFLACDSDFIAGTRATLFPEPVASRFAVECARGQTRYAAPDVAMTVYCFPVERSAR